MSQLEVIHVNDLYDRLDMKALQRALELQLPLVKTLGSLEASLIGMLVYYFAHTENCAAIDRIVLKLNDKKLDWPKALEYELAKCASLREQRRELSDWSAIYQIEARYILLLAHYSNNRKVDKAAFLKQYQLYACSHLLGGEDRPPFLNTEAIEQLIDPQSNEHVACYAQQYCKRHNKPELIERELTSHYSPF